MRIEFLTQEIARSQSKLAALLKRSEESQDVNELKRIATEIDETKEQIKRFEAEKAEAEKAEQKAKNPLPQPHNSTTEELARSEGYRKAFMAFIQRGEAIPAEYASLMNVRRAAGTTVASEISALTPPQIMDEVVSDTATGRFGQLYRRVRHLNVAQGVAFPVSELGATFSWITEGTCPTGDKAGDANTYVTFNAYLGQAQINTSLVAEIKSLPVFEREVARLLREAAYEALDTAIVKGSGTGQPEGITTSPRVTKSITLNSTEIDDWKAWQKKLIKAIPLSKRGGHIVLNIGTIDSHLRTLANDNNNPLFFDGSLGGSGDFNGGGVEGRFLGQWVLALDGTILPDFDTASNNDIIGFYAPLDDYGLNENLSLGVERFYDQKCLQYTTRELIICDGHPLDTGGMILIKKGADA